MHALSCARRGAQLSRMERGWERGLWGAHQPDRRLLAGLLLVPLSPPLESLVLGAGKLLLVAPGVAQEGCHLAQLGLDRLRRQLGRTRAGAERAAAGLVDCQVGGGNRAGRQAGEEGLGPFERLSGVGEIGRAHV